MSVTYVKINKTVRVSVTFADGDGTLLDQDLVELRILDSDLSLLSTHTPVEDSTGQFHYDWTPDTLGSYVLRFVGWDSFAVETVLEEEFVVESPVAPDTTPLGSDYEFSFISGVTPLYIDPEEILAFYPSASKTEVVELIHRFSLEVDKILGGIDPTFEALDYIRYSTLCSLSRSLGDANLGDGAVTPGS